VTPSGAPRNKHDFCSCSRLPKLHQNSLRRAITRTSPYEPQLAHSTGLPKLPGYNLEWSHVTPIRVTLITGRPAKASHHEHHLKLCRNLSSHIDTEPNPPGAYHTSLGENWAQTAWWASHTARRHAPAESSLHCHRRADSIMPSGALHCSSPPGAPSHAVKRQPPSRPFVSSFRLVGPSLPPGALHAVWLLSLG